MAVEFGKIIKLIYVEDEIDRQKLAEKLEARFHNDYLSGYFETVTSTDYGIWFIDYNQALGEMYSDFRPVVLGGGELAGQVGNRGRARGRVRIIKDPAGIVLGQDEVLVCDMTSPDYVPLMKQAAAIITDRGGILSHAAIVARELGKPCIVRVGDATRVLQNGDMVEVDADEGIIKKIIQ